MKNTVISLLKQAIESSNQIFFKKSILIFFFIGIFLVGESKAKTNSPPIANSDSYTGVAARSQLAPGILANDSDPNGNSLYVGGIVTYQTNGNVGYYANGSFYYTPNQ